MAEPGVEISAGDYLLAVNGIPVDTAHEPWAALAGLAGKTVELTIGTTPSTEGARRILVETLTDE